MTETTEQKDRPGVIAPPPLIYAAGLVAGYFLAWHYPYPIMPWNAAIVLGALLVLFGMIVILVAWLQMRAARTNIEPWHPTTAIVETGVYAISRNPIYVALAEMYLGFSLVFNSVWFLPFLPIVLLVIHFGVIRREERYLEAKFGDAYLDYKQRVGRWM